MNSTLDVGCGSLKRGDVGVDKKAFSNVDFTVDLDVDPLPFPDNSFSLVLSHHSLEHFSNPERVIREMLRVSNGLVRITCPHRFGEYARISREHKHVFNKRWFLRLAEKLGVEVNVKTTFTPAFYLGVVGFLCRPNELVVEMRKK